MKNGLVENSGGIKEWYKNGKLHRINGPALIYPDNDKYWYKNGKLHRTNGPAIEYNNGKIEWLINDEQIFPQDNTLPVWNKSWL